MQAKIETLKAKNAYDEEYLVYPRTLIKCVTNENGDSFEDTVKNMVASEVETDIQPIINGTQPVGDSAKLGGKDASEYALEEELTKRQLTYKSATTQDALLTILNDYSANFADGTAYEFYVNVRFSGNQLGSGVWHIEGVKTNSNFETQRASLYNVDVKLRGKFDGAWLEWEEIATIADLANYLPLSGGTVGSGSVNRPFKIKGALAPFLEFLNSDDIKVGSIGIASNGEPAIELSDGSLKGILHTGNKPTGTYIGNGDATRRNIPINGIGDTVLVRSSNGFAIVSSGAVAFSPTENNPVQSMNSGEASFDIGSRVFYMMTTNICLNAVGVEYKWYLL